MEIFFEGIVLNSKPAGGRILSTETWGVRIHWLPVKEQFYSLFQKVPAVNGEAQRDAVGKMKKEEFLNHS